MVVSAPPTPATRAVHRARPRNACARSRRPCVSSRRAIARNSARCSAITVSVRPGPKPKRTRSAWISSRPRPSTCIASGLSATRLIAWCSRRLALTMAERILARRGGLELLRELVQFREPRLVDQPRALLGEHHLHRRAQLEHVAHEARIDAADHRAAMRIEVEHALRLEFLQRHAHRHVTHRAQRRDVVDLQAAAPARTRRAGCARAGRPPLPSRWWRRCRWRAGAPAGAGRRQGRGGCFHRGLSARGFHGSHSRPSLIKTPPTIGRRAARTAHAVPRRLSDAARRSSTATPVRRGPRAEVLAPDL